MHRQQLQSCSLQTISIKLTENNLPSETVLKPSQQQISLTYTVSIQNIPQQKSLVYGNVKENFSISIEESMNLQTNDQRYLSQEKKLLEGSRTNNRNAFRKKSLLKISNLDFSNMFGQTKVDSSPQVNKPVKSIIRTNNSGLFARPSILNYESISGFNKNLNKSKQTFHFQSSEGIGEQILLRTSKFNSIKEDKIIEPLPLNKKFTIRKQMQKRLSCQSDRKSKKLPIIKGSNFHSSAPLSTSQRRKAFTSHQNMQLSDKCYGTLQQRTLMGKSCKINENDQKARKYLQKIILNRNSIIHFIETKKNIHRQFKENYEDGVY